MDKKGIVTCEHDTLREIHDKLWKIYREYTTPRKMLKGKKKGLKVRRVKVIEGPYEYTKGKRHGAWVIIDLYARKGRRHDTAVDYARELTRKLIAVKPKRVSAKFEILRKASP